MRTPFLVHVSPAEPGKGQTDGRPGLTSLHVDEPDDLDDDDDDDDFPDEDDGKRDDDEDDDEDDDDEEDEDDDEPETWQVGVGG